MTYIITNNIITYLYFIFYLNKLRTLIFMTPSKNSSSTSSYLVLRLFVTGGADRSDANLFCGEPELPDTLSPINFLVFFTLPNTTYSR